METNNCDLQSPINKDQQLHLIAIFCQSYPVIQLNKGIMGISICIRWMTCYSFNDRLNSWEEIFSTEKTYLHSLNSFGNLHYHVFILQKNLRIANYEMDILNFATHMKQNIIKNLIQSSVYYVP